MIELKKSYAIEFTEHQAKELYSLLKLEKELGNMTTDHDIILIYHELHKIFGVGVR